MTQLHDLVEQYSKGATQEGVRNLRTLFDSLKNDRDRAEALERAAFKQMDALSKRLSILESGENPEHKPREPRDPTKTQPIRNLVTEAKSETKKPSGAIEVEF